MDELVSNILSLFSGNDMAAPALIALAILVTVVLASSWARNKTHGGGW